MDGDGAACAAGAAATALMHLYNKRNIIQYESHICVYTFRSWFECSMFIQGPYSDTLYTVQCTDHFSGKLSSPFYPMPLLLLKSLHLHVTCAFN